VPELPEVETVVRDLRPRLEGRTVRSVKVGDRRLRRPWSPAWTPLLRGRAVTAVRRRGKWIQIALDDGRHLLVHLGMTGQLTVQPAAEPLPDHTHLVFTLDDGRQLRYRDVRRFGSATLFDDDAALRRFFETSGLGPEPFELDAGAWRRSLGATRRCLKACLLDQRLVAGVGNIYADESLFEARLHPERVAARLTPAQAGRLREAIIAVLNRAIARRGSSIRDYVGGSGTKGEFQNEFRVYGRVDQPCPRCGRPIVRVRLAGRSTHFCRRCQPAARA
jgi:formamidopyrimidine-DNA glycosylase